MDTSLCQVPLGSFEVRHESDLNMTNVYSSCLYQRGHPNCDGVIWDGHSERAVVYGSLPRKNSHIKGPTARSGYLITIGCQPDTKARALSRGTERYKHAEEDTAGVPGMTTCLYNCVEYCLPLLVDTRPSIEGTSMP